MSYQLGIKKRCAETGPLLVQRELFVYSTNPLATTESPLNSATSPRQGDGSAGSNNDIGNQSNCVDLNNGLSQACTGASRSNMVTSGQFQLSLLESTTTDKSTQSESSKSSGITSETKLFGFVTLNLNQGGGSEGSSPGAWEVDIDLVEGASAIGDAIDSIRALRKAALPVRRSTASG